jgi:anti-anti-sigma regulatory factor
MTDEIKLPEFPDAEFACDLYHRINTKLNGKKKIAKITFDASVVMRISASFMQTMFICKKYLSEKKIDLIIKNIPDAMKQDIKDLGFANWLEEVSC